MASKLAPWRRLLTLRSRVADGEQQLLKSAQDQVARAEIVYASYAFAGGAEAIVASTLTSREQHRDDSWHELLRCQQVAERAHAAWQAAKREQRQAELLLERHTAALEAAQEQREQNEREDWQRARFAGEPEVE